MDTLWDTISVVGSAALLLGLLSLVPYLAAWQLSGVEWARAGDGEWAQRMTRIARAMIWAGLMGVAGGISLLLGVALHGVSAPPSPSAVRVAVIVGLGIGLCSVAIGAAALAVWLLQVVRASLLPPTSAVLRENLVRFGYPGWLIMLLIVVLLVAVVSAYLGREVGSRWPLVNSTGLSRLVLGAIASAGFFVQVIAGFLFVFLLPRGSQRGHRR